MMNAVQKNFWWVRAGMEILIIAASLAYVVGEWEVGLSIWLLTGVIYVIAVFAFAGIMRGSTFVSMTERRIVARWTWIFSFVASIMGAYCAVLALIFKNSLNNADDVAGALVGSLGVVLSWGLLHIGFAQIYEVVDTLADEQTFRFPSGATARSDENHRVWLDYLYFSFTVGTSFATSDVEVTHTGGRSVVLAHSVMSFFYNALVVAVAFQVIQSLVK